MSARSDENLRAEYLLIQNQYEAFDQRALSVKGNFISVVRNAAAILSREKIPSSVYRHSHDGLFCCKQKINKRYLPS